MARKIIGTITGQVTLNECGCTIAAKHPCERGRPALHEAQRRVKHKLGLIAKHHDCSRRWEGNPNGDTREPAPPEAAQQPDG